MLDHAGELHEPTQRDLAPLAAHLGPAQGADEIARLALQGDLSERHPLDGVAQRAEGLGALLFDPGDLLVGALERLAHRRQHRSTAFSRS